MCVYGMADDYIQVLDWCGTRPFNPQVQCGPLPLPLNLAIPVRDPSPSLDIQTCITEEFGYPVADAVVPASAPWTDWATGSVVAIAISVPSASAAGFLTTPGP